VRIRIALPAEAEALTRLINLAFVVERFFIDGDRITIADVEERFRKGSFLAADEDGALAGCVYVEPRGDRAYLGLLSVDPSQQGGGVGRKLMTAAEDHARAQGCGAMDLTIVNLREELPPFYRKCGYAENGTAPFTQGVATKLPCHFIRMTKQL
jgi:GNAT superfamily N-acetyltransferase